MKKPLLSLPKKAKPVDEVKATPRPRANEANKPRSTKPSAGAASGEIRKRRDTSATTGSTARSPRPIGETPQRKPRESTKEKLFTPRNTPADQRFEAAYAHKQAVAHNSFLSERAKPKADSDATDPHDGKVRLSKLMSEQGICSRREADSYIVKGWVFVEGERVSELGTRVDPKVKIKLDRQAEARQSSRVTVLINKPIGYVSGQAEDGYQPASVLVVAENQVATDSVRFRPEHRRGLAPAGRLDIDSTGLLILTEDGRVAKQLIGEDSAVEKEYLVRVEGTLSEQGMALLKHGLELDGEKLKPAKVSWQNEDQLRFVLREGKKRQIRRMCELVGLKVVGLKRIRIGRVVLSDLPVGQWRFLRADEAF